MNRKNFKQGIKDFCILAKPSTCTPLCKFLPWYIADLQSNVMLLASAVRLKPIISIVFHKESPLCDV